VTSLTAQTTRPIVDAGPDPKAIPVPEIKNSLTPLPTVDQLPDRPDMPDIMTMNNGQKVTTPEQWKQRREEMKQILEYYVLGQAPPPPGNVKGREISNELLLDGKVRYRLVHLTFGPSEILFLDIGIFEPAEGGPFPAIVTPEFGSPPGATALPRLPPDPNPGSGDILTFIGPGAPPAGGRAGFARRGPVAASQADAAQPAATGASTQPLVGRGRGAAGRGAAPGGPFGARSAESIALSNLALQHGFAYVTYNNNDCGEDSRVRMPDGSWAFRTTRFFPAYPGYDWSLIRAWGWGASRIVDYLETDPTIDKNKLIISGVSRLGKSALFIGAFEDRFAMVAPVASSGGGTPAFRFSGPSRGGNEGLADMMRKYPNQFGPKLRQFFGHVDKLPFDQHWFVALCAPRPFIALEGLRDQNVNANAVRQTLTHAQSAYDLLGVPDRLGVYWTDRPHGMQKGDWEGLLGFADKFLLNKPVDLKFDQYPPSAYPK
jgi:hypothetical protein